jgi:hypothetical protein
VEKVLKFNGFMPEQGLRTMIRPSHKSKWIVGYASQDRSRGASLEAQPGELRMPPGLSTTKAHLTKTGHVRQLGNTQGVSVRPEGLPVSGGQLGDPVSALERSTSCIGNASEAPRQSHHDRQTSVTAVPFAQESFSPDAPEPLEPKAIGQQNILMSTGSPSVEWELVEASGESTQSKTPAIEVLENDPRETCPEGLDSEGRSLTAATKARVALPGTSADRRKPDESGGIQARLVDTQLEVTSAPKPDKKNKKLKVNVHQIDEAKERSRQESDKPLGLTTDVTSDQAPTNKQSVRGSKFTDDEIKERKRDSLRIATPLELQKTKERIEAEAAANSAKGPHNLPESYAKKVSMSISKPQGSGKTEQMLSKSASGKQATVQTQDASMQNETQRLEAVQMSSGKHDGDVKLQEADQTVKAHGGVAPDSMPAPGASHIGKMQPHESYRQAMNNIKPVEA